jgi:hypothetical protein
MHTGDCQALVPVNLCPTREVEANFSGVFIYDPSVVSNECVVTLNLTKLTDRKPISLLGISANPSSSCSRGETLMRVNDGSTYCTGDRTTNVNINNITDGQLKLAVVTPGSKIVEIEYYNSKLFQCNIT